MTNEEKNNNLVGHRKRLRDRFLNAPNAMPDYELLEMLLFAAIPRGDTKPIAKKLLNEAGGNLLNLINFPADKLKQYHGVGDATLATILMVKEFCNRIAHAETKELPILQNWKKVIDYCRTVMGNLKIEQFRILYLNTKNMLIADEIHCTGTVNETAVYVREILKRALYHEATAVILIHNHPSGDTAPSNADIAVTRSIQQALITVNIAVHDHLIISQSSHYSFKSNGLL